MLFVSPRRGGAPPVGGGRVEPGRPQHYDQVAFCPGETPELERVEVFDFDNALFGELFQSRPLKQFLAYTRYVSDHRPLWAEFRIGA